MKRLDRILAVIDPTADAQPALDKAKLLARQFDATLELFICDFDPSLSGQPFFDTDKLRELREEFITERVEFLEERADELRGEGIAIETHVHWDNPVFQGVLRRVQESSPDLVVKDTHYHTAIRRTLLTNTDWNLIRTCPAPLLLAKPCEWKPAPVVLAAVDPEHLGDKPAALDHDILDYARLVADCAQGRLRVVHAFFPAALLATTTGMAGMPMVDGTSARELVELERSRVDELLQGLIAEHQVVPDSLHLEQGAATEVLPRAAESMAADLLVMGAVSRSRLQELFIGSTAERVLDRIPCDVLVVKRPDFTEKLPF
jgi:universal stress protein E